MILLAGRGWLIVFLAVVMSPCGYGDEGTGARPTGASGSPTSYFLIIGKGKVADPLSLQQRGVAAVHTIAEVSGAIRPQPFVRALAEKPMTIAEYRLGERREGVTSAIVRHQFRWLADAVKPNDTVVVYTHSHGRRNGFEDIQPLGGLVLDLPANHPEHAGTLLWDEYVDLLLRIPAKNVLVLTMSCFSGGLIDYLESAAVKPRWQGRHADEGRNLVFITSQNAEEKSTPIVIGGSVINPFTYAVASALKGKADGFPPSSDQAFPAVGPDGRLTVGEVIGYILSETQGTVSESSRSGLQNNAKPRCAGSFERDDVLFLLR